MRKALVHEWYDTYVGSEKCVESFTNIWDDFDHYALIDYLSEIDREIILKGKSVTTSFIQSLPFSKKKFRYYLPLFPLAVEQFDLSEYDLIFSNSHAVAKGVLTRSDQLHICYCHSPMRYAWDLYHQYLREANLTKGLKSIFIKRALHRLRVWDYTTRNRVTYFIGNSHYTARRIQKTYDKEAAVIYPPVDTDKFKFEPDKDDFYLTASRLVYYKKIDLIVEAFTKMPEKRLVVVGDGPEMKKVKAKAAGSKNIEILGYVAQPELQKYMQKARAFVFSALEDFGIVVIEAMTCGTPVIALNKGGTSETVIDGKTGVHFQHQTAEEIVNAVNRFESGAVDIDPNYLLKYAQGFSRRVYEENIRNFVNEKIDIFFRNR